VKILIALLIPLLFFSCSQEEFYVDGIKAIPYSIDAYDQMGMALFVDTSLSEADHPMHFELQSPDGLLQWSFDAKAVTFDGTDYAGSPDICMPEGSELPMGTWKLKIAIPDGRVFDETFTVDYDSYASASGSEPYYGQLFSSAYSSERRQAVLEPVT
jgi:hypothetical protein